MISIYRCQRDHKLNKVHKMHKNANKHPEVKNTKFSCAPSQITPLLGGENPASRVNT